LPAEQVGKFTLKRVYDDAKVSFKADEGFDFFWKDALTQLSSAGGQDRTTRVYTFSLYLSSVTPLVPRLKMR
jgi:hypothetical protein